MSATNSAAAQPVVLITSRSFGKGGRDLISELADAGYDVIRATPTHDPAELRDSLGNARAWIAGTGPITAEHLALAPNLRVIARYGVGTDAVDLPAAAARGVIVTNTPGANSDAVADHALALTLAAIRGVVNGDRRVRSGDWSVFQGREIASLTCGVVGFGRIGRGYAARMAALGARVYVHDPFVPDAVVIEAGFQPISLDQIPAVSDVISLHLPGGVPIVDTAFLSATRPGAVVVNTARADLVDEQAVARALTAGTLLAFAADTLATETSFGSSAADGMNSPLLTQRLAARVIVTPHLGAQTTQAVDRMGCAAVADVLAVLTGQQPTHPVTPIEESAQ